MLKNWVIWPHWTSTINVLSGLYSQYPLINTHNTYYLLPCLNHTHAYNSHTWSTLTHTHIRTHTHPHLHLSSMECGTTSVRLLSTAACNPKTNTHTHADLHGEAHEPRAWCVWVFLRVQTHSYHCPTGKRQDCSGRTVGWTQVPLCLEGHYGGKGCRVLEIRDHTVIVTYQAQLNTAKQLVIGHWDPEQDAKSGENHTQGILKYSDNNNISIF